MTTYPEASLMKTISDLPIDPADLAYERERLRNAFHEMVLRRFLKAKNTSGASKAIVARRLRKRPEQITRWLSGPGNWTIDTLADIMTAIDCDPVELLNTAPRDRPSNIVHDVAALAAMSAAMKPAAEHKHLPKAQQTKLSAVSAFAQSNQDRQPRPTLTERSRHVEEGRLWR